MIEAGDDRQDGCICDICSDIQRYTQSWSKAFGGYRQWINKIG